MSNEEKKDSTNTTDRGAQDSDLTGHLELNRAKRDHSAGESEKRQKTFRSRFLDDLQKPRFYVEVAALLTVIAYTAFAGYQSCELKESTDAAVATVRAWVYPSDIDPPPPPELRLNNTFPMKFRNGRKTPATEIVITEEFKYWARHAHRPMPRFARCRHGPHWSAQPFKIGAIDPDITTKWIKVPIERLDATRQELNGLGNLQDGLLAHVCIEYRTVTGQFGLTEYCTVAYAKDLKATAPCLEDALIFK